ncbi:MAG: aminotransferase class I/II-fold pyridoxal phosphate-dependent enzyme [Cyanobacteria bacterium J06623_4]
MSEERLSDQPDASSKHQISSSDIGPNQDNPKYQDKHRPDSHHQAELSQAETPLVTALFQCARRANAAFHTPGHKRGQGTTSMQRQLFGARAFQADLPELPELDNLFAPEGAIAQAQRLAADLFGAQQTWFLANGSSCGIEAALMSACQPGEKVLIPRNAHTSVISGLILSGAAPVYITPQYSHAWDIPLEVTPKSVADALIAHPESAAIFLVSPTYHGVCSDIVAISQIAHRHNIPLIVDEAHGAHFHFHSGLPPSALVAGADISIQSTHKVLSAFTQAAMLHVQGPRINRQRLSQTLQLTQSTSPSYLLLGSLDAARHQMADAGESLIGSTIGLANEATSKLRQLPNINVLQPSWESTEQDNMGMVKGDRTRLTVEVSNLGLTGFQVDELLHNQYGVTAELPALRTLTFLLSLGNTAADIAQLIHGFTQLSQKLVDYNFIEQQRPARSISQSHPNQPATVSPFTPRQAFFASHRQVPCAEAIGNICAETICPYPPGIPLLLPGETITATAIAQLKTTLAAGGIITGCQDPSLDTILTIDQD